MDDKKPTSIPYHRKQHEAQQHNVAPRLKEVVKNRGIKPTRKHKKSKESASVPALLAVAQEGVSLEVSTI